MRPALLLLLLTQIALAIDYQVDASGGPDILSQQVAEAFAAWEAVEGAGFEAVESEDASTVLRYGNAALFGPDTVSLTASSSEGASRNVSVLLNPNAPTLLVPALLHETGVLAGVAPSTTTAGVMNPALSAETPSALSDEDRAALTALMTFAPEDLNRDGVVNFYDLALFAEAFSQSGVNLIADIDRDGAVDEKDLELLKAAYVFGPPSEAAPAATPATQPAEDGTGGTAADEDLGESLEDEADPEDEMEEPPPEAEPAPPGAGTGGSTPGEGTGGG